jgi:hypothetical protein
MSYIEALWVGDGAMARLHPDARRTHAGGARADEGAVVIAGKVDTETFSGHKNLRLVVDEQKGDVFVFWIVQGAVPTGGHVAERMRVKDGLITEIEVFVVMDEQYIDEIENPWPDVVGDAPGNVSTAHVIERLKIEGGRSRRSKCFIRSSRTPWRVSPAGPTKRLSESGRRAAT